MDTWQEVEVQGARWYQHAGSAMQLPSVTTVLEATRVASFGERKWRRQVGEEGRRAVLDIAQARGTMLDRWATDFMLGAEPTAQQLASPWWRSIAGALADLRLHMTDVETQGVVADVVGGYAGRFDIRGRLAGRGIVVDVKSASKPRRWAELRDKALQVTGYGTASYSQGLPVDSGLLVVAYADRPAGVWPFDISDHADEWADRCRAFWRKVHL